MADQGSTCGAFKEDADGIADEEINEYARCNDKTSDSNPQLISFNGTAQSYQIGHNYGVVKAYFSRSLASWQKSYQDQHTSDNRSYYKPYATVTNRVIKKRLIDLARHFNFLDCGFAEYFQSVVPSFDRDYVQQRLNDIREDITKRQRSHPTSSESPEMIYLGDLGEFCEAVSKTWNNEWYRHGSPRSTSCFSSTHGRDQEIFEYLQDAFETYYWELMLDIFLYWSKNSKSLSGDIVLKVLGSMGRDIRNGRNQLLRDIEAQSEDSFEDLAPIIRGIDERIAVLCSVGDLSECSSLDMQGLLALPVSKPQESQSTSPEEHSVARNSAILIKERENVGLIALILIFLIAAIVPGYIAFSISWKSSAPGSVHDADFLYLIQSSLMSVLGNLVMVIPLLKKSVFSPIYATMWMFFTLGLFFAVISIILYPLFNTGWSSMVAFFGSICSVASVLVMTQDAARDWPQKMKND